MISFKSLNAFGYDIAQIKPQTIENLIMIENLKDFPLTNEY
jgi:hypothetical protein